MEKEDIKIENRQEKYLKKLEDMIHENRNQNDSSKTRNSIIRYLNSHADMKLYVRAENEDEEDTVYRTDGADEEKYISIFTQSVQPADNACGSYISEEILYVIQFALKDGSISGIVINPNGESFRMTRTEMWKISENTWIEDDDFFYGELEKSAFAFYGNVILNEAWDYFMGSLTHPADVVSILRQM